MFRSTEHGRVDLSSSLRREKRQFKEKQKTRKYNNQLQEKRSQADKLRADLVVERKKNSTL